MTSFGNEAIIKYNSKTSGAPKKSIPKIQPEYET
jgi:hypothetical protein